MRAKLNFEITNLAALRQFEEGRFVYVVPTPNRMLIRKALEAGFNLPGVRIIEGKTQPERKAP